MKKMEVIVLAHDTKRPNKQYISREILTKFQMDEIFDYTVYNVCIFTLGIFLNYVELLCFYILF